MKEIIMKRKNIRVELYQDEIAAAPQDTVNRLRYCFPDLADADLLAMALRHPEVMRSVNYWRGKLRRYQNKTFARN
jgi:hypothetical protein